MFYKKFYAALLLLLVSANSIATENNSSINVDLGSDEQGNKSSAVSVVLAGNNDKEFLFGFGSSQVITGTDPVNSNFAYFGLAKKASDNWKFSGMFEYSGLKDAFTMLSASAPIRFKQNNYYMEAVPAIRSIRLTTVNNRKANISSSALGLKAGVFIGDHFRLSGSTYSYSYSHDVSKLATFASSRFFNEKTLILSTGLLKRSTNVEAGLDFTSFSVSLGKSRSVSAIDNSTSDYVYSVFDYYINPSWTVSLLLGEYLDTPKDQNNYSSIAVTYAF